MEDHTHKLSALLLMWIAFSFNQHAAPAPSTQKDLAGSKAKAEQGTTRKEGRFFSLEKLDARKYTLVLADSNEQKDSFVTLMPLDSLEISLLKNTGTNIILNYRNYFNPVRKRTEKLVQSMIPIYDLSSK